MRNTVLGVSCVENQILSLLSDNHMDCARLVAFSNSFIPLKDLYEAVINGAETFVTFNEIDRIQDELARRGLLRVKFCRTPLDKIIIPSATTDVAVLIRVKQAFSVNTLHTRGLRADHYVRVYRENGNLYLQNDIPPLQLQISKDALEEAYDQAALILEFQPNVQTKIDVACRAERRFAPESIAWLRVEELSIPGIPIRIFMSRLKDMSQIYKITRYRLQIYESYFGDVSWMEPIIQEIESVCGKIEYLYLKKENRMSAVLNCLHRLICCENMLNQTLNKNYGGHFDAKAD